jgi:hypothetical protein
MVFPKHEAETVQKSGTRPSGGAAGPARPALSQKNADRIFPILQNLTLSAKSLFLRSNDD